jgi:hypothetical protein
VKVQELLPGTEFAGGTAVACTDPASLGFDKISLGDRLSTEGPWTGQAVIVLRQSGRGI